MKLDPKLTVMRMIGGLLLVAMLAACQPVTAPETAAESAAVTEAAAVATPDLAVEELAAELPAAAEQIVPIGVTIEMIDVNTLVTPMGWRVLADGTERATQWVVPLESAGWAINSAALGEAGNVVIAGHQVQGGAVFAAIAAGGLVEGDEVIVTGSDGVEYLYTVTAISEPIPSVGATAEDDAAAAAFLAPTESAQLTLITGWPVDTTTHRIFVTAEPVAGE